MMGASLIAFLSVAGTAFAQQAVPAQQNSSAPNASSTNVNLQPPAESADTNNASQDIASGQLHPISTPPDMVAPGALTMGQLNQYRQQLAVLNFQVQIKELEAKEAQADAEIKNAKKGSDGENNTTPFGSAFPSMMHPVSTQTSDSTTAKAAPVFPTLQSMFGANGHMIATLNMPNGTTINAQTGDVLPNGMKVVAVSKMGVRVSNNNQITTLAFGAAPRSSETTPSANGQATTPSAPQTAPPSMPSMPLFNMPVKQMPTPFTPFSAND